MSFRQAGHAHFRSHRIRPRRALSACCPPYGPALSGPIRFVRLSSRLLSALRGARPLPEFRHHQAPQTAPSPRAADCTATRGRVPPSRGRSARLSARSACQLQGSFDRRRVTTRRRGEFERRASRGGRGRRVLVEGEGTSNLGCGITPELARERIK